MAELDKSAFLRRLDDGWDVLMRECRLVASAGLSETPLPAGWTPRGVLVHIAYWLELLASQIEAVRDGRPVPPGVAGGEPTDRRNAEVVAAAQGASWDETLERLRAAHERMRAQVGRLSDDRLFQAGRFPAIDSGPLARCIETESYDHYLRHATQLRALVDSAGR